MKIISYRYTNAFKQFFLISCMLYFLLCGVVISEIVIFRVPGYEVNIIGAMFLYLIIFITFFMLLISHKFCYTLYDSNQIIYCNKLFKRKSVLELNTVKRIVFSKRGVHTFESFDESNRSFYIPFFRCGIVDAIEIDEFYRKMKEIEGLCVIKEFKVLPGYGKGFKFLKLFYGILTAYMLLLCAKPLATIIILFQHFA